jgi:hypothetical protein
MFNTRKASRLEPYARGYQKQYLHARRAAEQVQLGDAQVTLLQAILTELQALNRSMAAVQSLAQGVYQAGGPVSPGR